MKFIKIHFSRYNLVFLFLFLMNGTHAGTMGDAVHDPWQGMYFGGNLGAAWGTLHHQINITNNSLNPLFYSPSLPDVNANGSNSFNPLRFTGGAQIGWNQDISHQVLLGLEISYDYLGLSQSSYRSYAYRNAPRFHIYSWNNTFKATQIGTLRPRIGYHYHQFLPYITGGGAVTSIRYNQTFIDHQYGFTQTIPWNKTQYGWVLGGGIEYLPLERISFKIEYLYAGFGNTILNTSFVGQGALAGLSATAQDTLNHIAIQTLLLGINFHIASL